MLYSILSLIIRIALKIFYRSIQVNGAENIPKQGPMIIVGNHPNTFMDPILVGYAVLPHHMHFLANGSIFKTKLARMALAQLNTIPVYRKQDIHENRQLQNEEAFRKCFEFLASGGKLMIFPEGNSINERTLRPLRTGTARIALGAEHLNNFTLPLTILPIGINYSNPTRFREEVLINVGQPFDLKKYKERYQHDAVAAVNELTQEIHQRLSSLIVVTAHAEEDDLVRKIETVYKKQVNPTTEGNAFNVNLTQTIIKAINYFQKNDPVLFREVKEKIDTYFETIKQVHVTDHLIEKSDSSNTGKLLRYALYFITGLPFYLLGLVFNYIPYIIPSKIARWISKDEEYRAPIMMTTGIFTFPIYYALVYIIGWHFYPTAAFIIGLTLAMPLTGFFVHRYYKRLRQARSSFAYYSMFKREKDAIQWFKEQRQEIISMLESARKQYQ
jgi:1-acyl-sn-glycerol-3-phosphate acyltransferase